MSAYDHDAPMVSSTPEMEADHARAMEAEAAKTDTFEVAWARYEAAGYRYGSDALEQVRFGFEIARGKRPPAESKHMMGGEWMGDGY